MSEKGKDAGCDPPIYWFNSENSYFGWLKDRGYGSCARFRWQEEHARLG